VEEVSWSRTFGDRMEKDPAHTHSDTNASITPQKMKAYDLINSILKKFGKLPEDGHSKDFISSLLYFPN